MEIDKQSPRKRKKGFKWLAGIVLAVLVYTVVGFFIAPAIIKSQMLERLPALTKRQVAIAQVQCNPFVLSLTLRGFSLKEPDGGTFISFDEFYGNFQLWASLFKRSWVFREIRLEKPFSQITYLPDGTFNFANLLNNAPAQTTSAAATPYALPSAIIYNLSITNGMLSFADLNRKVPFHKDFAPIDVVLTNLSTIRDKNSPYMILARTGEGETFAWSGTVTVNPLRSDGEFRLGGLKLGQFGTYAHDYAKFDILTGLLDIAADYRYDSVTNSLDLSVSNAAVYLTDFKIKAPDTGEIVLSVPTLSVTGVAASVARMTARIALVKSSGGLVLVRQNQDSTINLLSMLNLPISKPADEKAATSSGTPPLVAKIDEIALDNYTIKAEDKKPSPSASFDIDHFALNLKGVSNATNAPVSASVSMRFQETGSISVDGSFTLLPLSADLQLELTNLDLRALQPYVQQQIKLAITSGNVDLHGHARYTASPESGQPVISFTGGVAVRKLSTIDDVLFKDFAKWDSLVVEGINLNLQPDKLQVEQVRFSGLDTSVVVGPDHRINLQTILRNQIGTNSNLVANSPGQMVGSPKKPSPDVALGSLVFENASLHFADQSIEPHCAFDVQEFSGNIEGVSTRPDTTATIDVKGKVDSHSTFNVTGKVHPLGGDLFADVAVAFTNTELTAFTPYTEKFAGRPLQKGKVSFGVHYLIQKDSLKAENAFYVDQLTLGPKNNSPDATTLPVKLGIALLKDRRGRIQLNVPVAGRLNDPKFRLGPIIWQVVVNVLVKAAASPFSLLGAMFGGGDELSFVNFAPGQMAIPDTETNKLETLVKALYERPELTMEINGSADTNLDREPLAQIKLNQRIKALRIKELADAGKSAVSVDELPLDAKDYDRLLIRYYKKAFGTYHPLETTNQPMVSPSQKLAFKNSGATSHDESFSHGARNLFTPFQNTPAAKSSRRVSVSNAPVAPTPVDSEIAGMTARLLQQMDVTEDDFRALMNQRAASVQAYLLRGQKISADRLFITAPKPVGGASKGEARVDLSLD